MKKLIFAFFLLVGYSSLNAQILTFEFSLLAGNEATANSNFNTAGIGTSTISRGVGLTASSNGGRFNATNWATGSIANAVSGNNYMEFTITPDINNQFSISSIVIQLQRSGTGPSAIALRSSIDAYAANLDGEKAITDNTSTQSFTFTFSQANSTTAVTYRIYMYAESTGGSGGPGDGSGNDITVNGAVSSSTNPTIVLSSPSQITAGNVNQGALNHIFSAFQAAVTDDDATVNEVEFTSAGTYSAAGDLSNYRLWYHTANSFGAATNIATVAAGVATGNPVSFGSLTQQINENATGYFWITVDVAAGATATNTIIASGHSMTFASGNQSGSITDGAAQTIQSVTPSLALSSPNPAIAAANFDQNTTNNVIYRFDMAMTVANTDLTAVDITTNGTYAANAVSNLKAWYSTDASFDAGSDVLLATIASPATAGAQSFSGFTQTLLNGNTSYIFITVDISCDALDGATIGVDAISTAGITTTASESGSTSASGTHTLNEITPNNATALNLSIANASITTSWTNPTACYDEIMIVAKAGSTIAGTPTGDGSAYTADLDFSGAGTAFDGGKVVYKGSTSDQTITGLTNGTQYFVRIFTRNGESWSAGVEDNATPQNIVTVNFDDDAKWSASPTSYGNHTYTDGVVSLQGTNVLRNGTSVQDAVAGALGTYSVRIRDAASSKLVATISSGGVNTFSFNIRRWDGTPDPDYTLRYSTDGGDNYTNVDTINNAALDGSSDWKTFNGTINSPLNNILIEIVRNNGERIMVDNFVYTPRAFESTTWNGSAWSNGTPDATKNATISGNLTVAAGFSANNLTIDNAVTVTLDAGQDLTVNGSFENNGSLDLADNTLTLTGTYSGSGSIRSNGGSLVVNGSGALGTLNFDQTTDGTTNTLAELTINRSSTGSATLGNKLNLTTTLTLTDGVLNTGGNLHLKSTSATATAQVIGGTNASIVGNVTVERFLPWASADNNGFRFVSHPLRSTPVLNTVANLPVANNSMISYNEAGNAYAGLNDRTASWPLGIGYGVWANAVNTLSFTGELQLSDLGNVSMSNADQRYNLSGNPFPSVLDWESVTVTDMEDAIWTWVKDNAGEGSGAWASYVNGVGANGGTQYIAPMQGFMVRAASSGSPAIAFPAAARVSGQTPTFNRTGSLGDIFRVRVENASNGSGLEAVIRFHDMGSVQFDPSYDAGFISDFEIASPDLYMADQQGNKYSINSLPALGMEPVLVPLQIETFGPGAFSFQFDASAMQSASSVQLEDTKLGTFTAISNGQTIQFTAGANDATDRFRLHFNGLATSVAANQLDQVQLYSHEGALYVKGIEQAEQLRILDISGRMVFELNAPQFDGNAIQPNLNKGTYLVQLIGAQGVKTVKVIL